MDSLAAQLVPPTVTQPRIGGIEDGIGSKAGKQHHQTIDDTAARVNRGFMETGNVRVG